MHSLYKHEKETTLHLIHLAALTVKFVSARSPVLNNTIEFLIELELKTFKIFLCLCFFVSIKIFLTYT